MKQIPIYEFDYDVRPGSRWDKLSKRSAQGARTVNRRAAADWEAWRAVPFLSGSFRLMTKGRNPYRGEIRGASRALGIPYQQAVLSNFNYELHQLLYYGFTLWRNELGPSYDSLRESLPWLPNLSLAFDDASALACTAGALYSPTLGMTHVRSMDWSLTGLGRHSLLLHHVNVPAGDFYSLGWSGYSGVLSGMKPGCFSATLNQAYMFTRPTLQWPPSHLLRHVFEECETFDEALYMLRYTPVCVPSFILLVGARKNEAAVVEMMPSKNRVHRMKSCPIAVGNDYFSSDWRRTIAKRDGEFFEYLAEDTRKLSLERPGVEMDDRRSSLLERMRGCRINTLKQALKLLQANPIQHEDSMQQMVFCPAAGKLFAVGREDNQPVSVREVAG